MNVGDARLRRLQVFYLELLDKKSRKKVFFTRISWQSTTNRFNHFQLDMEWENTRCMRGNHELGYQLEAIFHSLRRTMMYSIYTLHTWGYHIRFSLMMADQCFVKSFKLSLKLSKVYSHRHRHRHRRTHHKLNHFGNGKSNQKRRITCLFRETELTSQCLIYPFDWSQIHKCMQSISGTMLLCRASNQKRSIRHRRHTAMIQS